jgi:hypothetical protein
LQVLLVGLHDGRIAMSCRPKQLTKELGPQ